MNRDSSTVRREIRMARTLLVQHSEHRDEPDVYHDMMGTIARGEGGRGTVGGYAIQTSHDGCFE